MNMNWFFYGYFSRRSQNQIYFGYNQKRMTLTKEKKNYAF